MKKRLDSKFKFKHKQSKASVEVKRRWPEREKFCTIITLAKKQKKALQFVLLEKMVKKKRARGEKLQSTKLLHSASAQASSWFSHKLSGCCLLRHKGHACKELQALQEAQERKREAVKRGFVKGKV